MLEIRDLDMLKDIDILYSNEIILYGAGDYGNRALGLLNKLEISVLGLCDSNKEIWGKKIAGYKVLSIQELEQISTIKKDLIVIMTMADPDNVEQVLGTLESYRMTQMACYTYFALQYAVELHANDKRIPKAIREEFRVAKKLWRGLILTRIELDGLSMLCDVVFHKKSVLILQPGKVGSNSVKYSLINRQINCLHAHMISDTFLGCDRLLRERVEGVKLLDKSEETIKIISMIREPIGRDISFYFELFYGEYTLHDCVKADTYKGVNDYLDKNSKVGEFGWIFEWFYREIKGSFGIDVYQYDFDKVKGYQIIKKDNIELLLIKAEKLDDCQEIIGQFVGDEGFKLVNENVGFKKLYRFAYEKVKKTIRIPEYILDFYYKENKCMDHFYTSEEKKKFAQRWRKGNE